MVYGVWPPPESNYTSTPSGMESVYFGFSLSFVFFLIPVSTPIQTRKRLGIESSLF